MLISTGVADDCWRKVHAFIGVLALLMGCLSVRGGMEDA